MLRTNSRPLAPSNGVTRTYNDSMLGEPFAPSAEFSIQERCKPHWSQAGAIVFITFRLADSIPAVVIDRWDRERVDWLHRAGHPEATTLNWKSIAHSLEQKLKDTFQRQFRQTHERFLDDCHGACVLRRPEIARIVADALHHFDGIRYRLGDFVVMPNHVHLLASFADPDSMSKRCFSWLHFTAKKINAALERRGKLWQSDAFDHLVRSGEQYEYLRRYIEENPEKANLCEGQFLHWVSPDG